VDPGKRSVASAAHEDCPGDTLREGFPLVVVVDSLETWLLAENPELFAEAISDSVRVTGQIRSEGVLVPRSVAAKIEEEWVVLLDPATMFEVSGTVTGATDERDMLIVRHDAIEGYMGAMTMPFAVRDTSLISGLAAGDSVRFTIQVSGSDAIITSVNFVGLTPR
jgi:hypothetical protein